MCNLNSSQNLSLLESSDVAKTVLQKRMYELLQFLNSSFHIISANWACENVFHIDYIFLG